MATGAERQAKHRDDLKARASLANSLEAVVMSARREGAYEAGLVLIHTAYQNATTPEAYRAGVRAGLIAAGFLTPADA